MSKITPLNWYVTGPLSNHIQSAKTNEDNYVCAVEGNTDEQATANAEFIVKACNAYAELVKENKRLNKLLAKF